MLAWRREAADSFCRVFFQLWLHFVSPFCIAEIYRATAWRAMLVRLLMWRTAVYTDKTRERNRRGCHCHVLRPTTRENAPLNAASRRVSTMQSPNMWTRGVDWDVSACHCNSPPASNKSAFPPWTEVRLTRQYQHTSSQKNNLTLHVDCVLLHFCVVTKTSGKLISFNSPKKPVTLCFNTCCYLLITFIVLSFLCTLRLLTLLVFSWYKLTK